MNSSVAKSIASHGGTGKNRHRSVKELWLQEVAKYGSVRLCKIGGEVNPADMLTKYLAIAKLEQLSRLVNLQVCFRLVADAEGECW